MAAFGLVICVILTFKSVDETCKCKLLRSSFLHVVLFVSLFTVAQMLTSLAEET